MVNVHFYMRQTAAQSERSVLCVTAEPPRDE